VSGHVTAPEQLPNGHLAYEPNALVHALVHTLFDCHKMIATHGQQLFSI
jgi:hypothetical protein